jgi:hypothetical protein
MNFQLLVVVLLVALSFAYAAWTLMPLVLRAALARGLLRLPSPDFLRQPLLAAANARPGCGCSGCDKAPVATQSTGGGTLSGQAQPLVFHRRNKS